MSHEDFSLPAKVNTLDLTAALYAAGAEDVVIGEAVNWTRLNPDGTEYIETEPGKVQVRFPDERRGQIVAVVRSHKPNKSDSEAATEREQSKREAMRSELRAYMLEFLRDPDLLAMLKQALA